VIGDFNYPKINWLNNTAESVVGREFLNVCLDNNLTQYVDFVTHEKNNMTLYLIMMTA